MSGLGYTYFFEPMSSGFGLVNFAQVLVLDVYVELVVHIRYLNQLSYKTSYSCDKLSGQVGRGCITRFGASHLWKFLKNNYLYYLKQLYSGYYQSQGLNLILTLNITLYISLNKPNQNTVFTHMKDNKINTDNVGFSSLTVFLHLMTLLLIYAYIKE